MKQKEFQELAVKHLMNLSSDVKSLKGSVSSLEGRFSSLENTVLRMETRMENEIIDKIKGLFDGHKQHDKRLNRIENAG